MSLITRTTKGSKLTIAEMDGNLTYLDNKVPTPQFQYEIGQYVASEGGVIAHRWLSTSAFGTPTAGTVQNYLVLDTNDLSSKSVWSDIDNLSSGALSTWNGQINTNTISTQPGATTGAAFLCADSINNGKTDWYLPAIDELNKVLDNRWEIAQGITAASGTQLPFGTYWSSTETNFNNAWSFSFRDGTAYSGDTKDNTIYVRAMRRFSI